MCISGCANFISSQTSDEVQQCLNRLIDICEVVCCASILLMISMSLVSPQIVMQTFESRLNIANTEAGTVITDHLRRRIASRIERLLSLVRQCVHLSTVLFL